MSASSPTDPDSPRGGVTIGDVYGGIHDSIIAGGSVTIGQRIINVFLGGSEQQRALRSRQAMLQLVRNTWIKGVLEQSLHGAAMIELGLEERADAVERPWDIVVQMPGQTNRQLPHGTQIVQVFDETGRSLLILGEPGSGKTTMLLELARAALDCADRDPGQPIPVVLNLASWAEKRQPIGQWLLDELMIKYGIPKKIAQPWIEHDELLLLLDGLDEVRLELRGACVGALNGFRREHLVPMAVCSRVTDYEPLAGRLTLHTALVLKPLTSQQIDEYLVRLGPGRAALRALIDRDPALRELGQTPLMLSVMILACLDGPDLAPGAGDSIDARRRRVFGAFVQSMFTRRGSLHPYRPRQTTAWLAWLARRMLENGQSVLVLSQMSGEWLPGRMFRRLHRLALGLLLGLLYGLLFGLSAGLVLILLAGLPSGLGIGLGIGLGVGLVVALSLGVNGRLAKVVMIPLAVGLGSALVVRASGQAGQAVWVVGFCCWIASIPIVGDQPFSKPFKLKWDGVYAGLAMGLCGGLAGLALTQEIGLFAGLTIGLVLLLNCGLVQGASFGSLEFLHDITLRVVLFGAGQFPLNQKRFLDYAADRIFLRKVGGGYIFVHRLLMDYFASLDDAAIAELTKPI